MLVLKNCKLVPFLTENTDLEKADLLLKDGLIQKIAPCGTDFAEDHETLDCEGQIVMPGMMDIHTHLRMLGGSATSDPLKPCAVTLDEYMFATNFLNRGFTTVRDVGDNIANPAIALRNHINSGKLVGPRIFCSGPTLTPTELGFDAAWSVPNHYEIDSPMQMRKYVRLMIQQGSDFIKLYGSGSMMIKNGQPGALIMEPDEMAEAVKMAARKNTYCAIHAHGTETCEVAAKVGVRTIEHASFIAPETLKYLEGHKAEGQGIVITISVFDNDDPLGTHKPASIVNSAIDHLRKARDYDVLIGWGTDTNMQFHNLKPSSEFEMRSRDLGFTNQEIMEQLTKNSAKLIMKDSMLGTVKEGKFADLIVVDGNPEEDLSALYTRVSHVIKGGALIR